MLSPGVIRAAIIVALAAHGVAHGIALVALVGQAAGNISASAIEVRSWLAPNLGTTVTALLAIPFWLLSSAAFLVAALALWGVIVPDWPWRQIAVGGALFSVAGIAVFSAVWPGGDQGLRALHIGAAMAMNLAILGAQIVLHWPEPAWFGR